MGDTRWKIFVAGMTNQGDPNMSEMGIFSIFIPGGSQ